MTGPPFAAVTSEVRKTSDTAVSRVDHVVAPGVQPIQHDGPPRGIIPRSSLPGPLSDARAALRTQLAADSARMHAMYRDAAEPVVESS